MDNSLAQYIQLYCHNCKFIAYIACRQRALQLSMYDRQLSRKENGICIFSYICNLQCIYMLINRIAYEH